MAKSPNGEAAKEGPPPSPSPLASERPTVQRKKWEEFCGAGLLWWINRVLHLFGWAIVLVEETDGSISDAYPARVRYRGFGEKDEEDGFRKVSRHLEENATHLRIEAEER